MFKENYNVIGVMSGTSLDGVDLACIKFNYSGRWTFEIGHSETISYSEKWLNSLKEAIHYSEKKLQDLNVAYTKLLASVISDFISRNSLTGIDAVCSHGHTILHQPQNAKVEEQGHFMVKHDLHRFFKTLPALRTFGQCHFARTRDPTRQESQLVPTPHHNDTAKGQVSIGDADFAHAFIYALETQNQEHGPTQQTPSEAGSKLLYSIRLRSN